MKLLRTTVAAALLLVAISGFAVARKGGPVDRAQGGGQILFDTQTTGAGNTIAFTIRGAGEAVNGQFQYVDRSGGVGQAQDSWHGSPVCLEVSGNMAKAVISRNDTGDLYELILVDNGQGDASEDDVVTLTTDEEPTCGSDDDDDDDNTSLGRGNIQIYDAP